MYQQQVITQLLAWIEQNLDQPLTLDDIAAKSGYSKWHLQRLFKQLTGHVLGTYARRRRLSAAARELRLTHISVACIADKYQFDSQQTFTRCFKKQFGLPPAGYRRSPDWASHGMQPPLRLSEGPLPQADIVTLPAMQLVGRSQRGNCTLGQLPHSKHELRQHAWRQMVRAQAEPPAVVYGLTSLEADSRQRGGKRIVYTVALADEQAEGERVLIEQGDYASFVYQGRVEELQNFIARLYDTAIPMMKAVRRPGQDIERFYPAAGGVCNGASTAIRCEYLIPIRRMTPPDVAL
ncbi:helix-turn-helix domain-containing protein [Serratia plymuthica]|uniref:helix-turn-helix domain-containing protein n=1 Tax=Serratia plymuthica TaxID=82996 RepID=UPI00093790DD|nr:helix-turn-helix domain-containing protein [Serratia plymuthica]OJT36015.1 AraC family transcriptional regulator [Serratia plymuthica]